MKESKRKENALRVLTLIESVAMLNQEDFKDVYKEYTFETLDTLLRHALSNIEDIEEESQGLPNLYTQALKELEEEREIDNESL